MMEEEIDQETGPEAADGPGTRDWFWLGACGAITALAAVLRFAYLGLKPLHHDEGVNGYFLTDLFRKGVYHYDPANYHGPTLYYIALVFAKLFGLETVPVRASVAVWGVFIVVLCFYLRPYIGYAGALFAGLFVALSPGMVFISRYFIHEIFFVFLSLAIVISMAYFIEGRKAGVFSIVWMALIMLTCLAPSVLTLSAWIGGDNPTVEFLLRIAFFVVEAVLVFLVIFMLVAWNEGRPIYFLLAVASTALMFATKETAFITIGTMLIACICVAIWLRIYKGPSTEPADDEINDTDLTWRNFVSAAGGGADRTLLFVAAAVLIIYLILLFFSSFFTYKEGVWGFLEAYKLWTQTGSKDHTQNGMWAYLRWGLRMEAPLFILSAIGTLVAFIKGRHRFAMFTGLWAFGLLAAYTLIPYKTPWLALSFLLPMCIAGGYAIGQLVRGSSDQSRFVSFALGIGAAAIMAYQTYDLNFVHYDDNDLPYVYAHTYREINDLVGEIDHYAAKSGKGRDAQIEIVSPDYWPLVWYLKDYNHADFWGHTVDVNGSEMIVAKKGEQDGEMLRRYSSRYEYAGSWRLRPGVDLMLLVRRDLADTGAEELYKIENK